eukprot:TRINITY_DN5538_c0_g1_i1.p3 TRINITY_DN5538_c0_g1~~TRINITY_DN5538_c0_g1_i1.p3  ORF type:complete len:106 (+),score=3.79 TRINITY_DN5538_c0_g1_i1:679-996(+)
MDSSGNHDESAFCVHATRRTPGMCRAHTPSQSPTGLCRAVPVGVVLVGSSPPHVRVAPPPKQRVPLAGNEEETRSLQHAANDVAVAWYCVCRWCGVVWRGVACAM